MIGVYVIERDDIDDAGESAHEFGEGFRLLRGVVDLINEQVFEGDFASGGAVVVAHGLDDFGDGPAVVDGHEAAADFVEGAVEAEGEVDGESFFGEALDLGDKADGGDGDVAEAEADFFVEDADGLEESVEIEEGFAHAHEDDVADPAGGEVLEVEILGDNFAGGEIAVESAETGGAEGAAHGATDLLLRQQETRSS